MDEIYAPPLRLQMAISDCIRNRSLLETLENLDFGVISETMIVGSIFHIPFHLNKDLKRLAEHWIIISICCEGDPRKVFKKI